MLQELELVLWHFEANYTCIFGINVKFLESESICDSISEYIAGICSMFTKACTYSHMAIASNLSHIFSKINATYALNSRKHIYTKQNICTMRSPSYLNLDNTLCLYEDEDVCRVAIYFLAFTNKCSTQLPNLYT